MAAMLEKRLIETLSSVAKQYPAGMVVSQLDDISRIAFHIDTVAKASRPKPLETLAICDVGGGVGLFSVGCAALGFRRVVLIDDFRDAVNTDIGDDVLGLHRGYGVEVCCRDVISQGVNGLSDDFDVITSFDSMEHWHHSPKRLFRELVSRLKVGGVFVLGVPNCVNLRKRLTAPFGYGKWSALGDWYEQDTFRGHVREPDVDDLRYIAKDLGLQHVKLYGRNWLGAGSSNGVIRLVSRLLDLPLRLRPSLCSDIYVLGKKS
jgi:2-polyprenyl-3-methyl-5-hydroxy-6-metoxy-1,4-benzoquinol methylase